MSYYQLAQFNIARVKAPLDHPTMEGFVSRLPSVNALAEASPGFVWRLQTPRRQRDQPAALRRSRDHRRTCRCGNRRTALRAFVYRSGHAEPLRQRLDWFETMPKPFQVMWWVPAGHRPTVAEATRPARLPRRSTAIRRWPSASRGLRRRRPRPTSTRSGAVRALARRAPFRARGQRGGRRLPAGDAVRISPARWPRVGALWRWGSLVRRAGRAGLRRRRARRAVSTRHRSGPGPDRAVRDAHRASRRWPPATARTVGVADRRRRDRGGPRSSKSERGVPSRAQSPSCSDPVKRISLVAMNPSCS